MQKAYTVVIPDIVVRNIWDYIYANTDVAIRSSNIRSSSYKEK